MKPTKVARFLFLGSVAALGAMGAQAQEEACRMNCQVQIDLPADARQPPESTPERMIVAAGQALNFVVRGGPAGQEATELRFQRPNTPLLDDDGNPLFTAELQAGSNRFRTRAWDEGVCRPPNGCKYDIVNTGNSQRPPKDPWIILGP